MFCHCDDELRTTDGIKQGPISSKVSPDKIFVSHGASAKSRTKIRPIPTACRKSSASLDPNDPEERSDEGDQRCRPPQIARGRHLIDPLHQKFLAALQIRDVGSPLVGGAKREAGGIFVGHDLAMLVEDG
jgi:hypothetical protein